MHIQNKQRNKKSLFYTYLWEDGIVERKCQQMAYLRASYPPDTNGMVPEDKTRNANKWLIYVLLSSRFKARGFLMISHAHKMACLSHFMPVLLPPFTCTIIHLF